MKKKSNRTVDSLFVAVKRSENEAFLGYISSEILT